LGSNWWSCGLLAKVFAIALASDNGKGALLAKTGSDVRLIATTKIDI
jgi:hypothetical protein